MPQLEFLQDLVIIFGLSIGVVLLFQRLHLPSIIGFLISGALLGPHGLNLIDDAAQVEVLAEVGVVLLLFTIGLEFSLTRLSRIRAFALSGGSLQVGLTILVTAVTALLLGIHFRTGIFWGFLLALSSTAIVLKMLLDRGEIDAPHGRLSLGILIFQDLIMVPMMLILPLLSEDPNGHPFEVILALGRSFLLLGAILVAARWLVPKALSLVVRSRSRELFIISVILICLGIAWVSALSGLSLALGAFIAGLVISESEYSHQALADILPFRDSFNSLFFISIGMLLDWRFFIANPFLVLSAAILVIFLKGLIAGGVTVGLGYPARVALLVGLGLVQVGEFSFVLATAGQAYGLLLGESYQLFLTISILTMMATPFLIQLGPRLSSGTDWISGVPSWLKRSRTVDLEPQDLALKDHVIVAGYGLNGRNLARVLKETNIPYAVLDLHGETVRHHRELGEPIYFGDVTRTMVLRRLGIKAAKLIVLAVSDPFAVRRAVQLARAENPDITIIVRTRYVTEVEDLLRLGANQVVPEEFETSLEIFDLVLRSYDVPASKIERKKAEVRRESYAKLRRGEIEPVVGSGNLPGELQVERFTIPEGSSLTRETLSGIDLPAKTGTLVVAVIRGEETVSNPRGSFRVQPGDVLVSLGNRESLSRAKVYFEESKEHGGDAPGTSGPR
jgi:CPA2 family monovalent cation:H+ antiporter-2